MITPGIKLPKLPKFKRYYSLKKLLCRFFKVKEYNLKEIFIDSVGIIRGTCGKDNMHIPVEEIIRGIRKVGIWGFYQYTNPKTICYWTDKGPSEDIVIHFFAHELTHHYKTLIQKKDEEIRAEIIAQICLKSIELSKKV